MIKCLTKLVTNFTFLELSEIELVLCTTIELQNGSNWTLKGLKSDSFYINRIT